MGIRDFTINTNHPFNLYTSGQTVRGKVHFKLHTSKIVQGVYVRFKGIAQTQWDEEHKRGDDKVTVRYRGEREYFDEILYLVGDSNGESFELLPGEYNYKFEYSLPIGLPTSFKGLIGSIIYTITAVLHMPWGMNDEVETRLQVVSPIDLNKTAHLKKPANVSASKNLCCLWCKSGPITIEVNLQKTGYTNCEPIRVIADIENKSNTIIRMVEFKIDQKITYHSDYPARHTRELSSPLCTKQFPGVPAYSTQSLDERIELPDVPVVNFTNCHLFDVRQSLNVKVYIDGCYTNLTSKIPITLGNIPIIKFEDTSAIPVPIMAGLGTPYPHEIEEGASNIQESGPNYSVQCHQYGWWLK